MTQSYHSSKCLTEKKIIQLNKGFKRQFGKFKGPTAMKLFLKD